MIPFLQGFGIGAGLIIAIGAQNSFVLSQGVRRQCIFLIPLICTLCDIILIAAGAAGVGAYVARHPQLAYYSGIGGILFLFWYGSKSLCQALRNGPPGDCPAPPSRRSLVATTVALSLLNPHVYFDTIVMLGSLGGRYPEGQRAYFALGACCSSALWFYSLSLCGSLLEPLFRRPRAWRILDLSVCAVMWSIALSLWKGLEYPG